MNGCVPNWDMDDDYRSFHGLLPTAHSKKSSRIDQELMELVWQNGHVIMQNQTNRKTSGSIGEPKQTNKHEVPTKCGAGLSSLTDGYQEDEHASWLQYSLENSLDKDLYSELFSGMPVTDSAAFEKLEKDTMGNDKYIKSRVADETNIWTEPVPKLSNRLHISQNLMPPPKLQTADICTPQAGISETAGFVNFSHFARSTKFDSATTHCNLDEKDLEVQKQSADSSSNATKASGNCGSNLILNRPGLVRTVSNGISDAISKQVNDVQKNMREKGQVETHETATITSSSAGSGSSVGKTGPQSISNQIHKRKGREAEDSECQSEGTEYQSIEDGRTLQRKSARRSRAAEVHNLSERRRRDRINEKMRALQELIPHCNKTDKASMLDEAIEYLKSLQLQVQMMWMGNGMAPMMFPTAQHYLSLMGRGIESSIPSAVQMPRVSLVNPSIPSAATVSPTTAAAQNFTANSYPSPLQNANVADIYARYLGFQQMQPPQGVNLFASYGSQMVDSNQATLISDNIKQQNGGPSPQSGKTG